MTATRRFFTAVLVGFSVLVAALPAMALEERQAIALVEATLEDMRGFLDASGAGTARSDSLRAIMENRANMPKIAQFSAGRAWRTMTTDQKSRFQGAFSHYIAVTYASRFAAYSGDPTIEIGRSIDAGRKGFLVETTIRDGSNEPVVVEWLISDRGGRVEVVDIVVEGISMAATEREQISSMLDSRGGDVDTLIADLQGMS